MSSSLSMKTMMRMTKEAVTALARMEITRVTIAAIVGGAQALTPAGARAARQRGVSCSAG